MVENGYIVVMKKTKKLYVNYRNKVKKAHQKLHLIYFESEKQLNDILETMMDYGYLRGDTLNETSFYQQETLWDGDYSFIEKKKPNVKFSSSLDDNIELPRFTIDLIKYKK